MGLTERCLAWFTLLSTAAGTAPAAIRFENFRSIEGLSVTGDASVPGGRVRLTPAKTNRRGAVWFREKQPIASGFETTFQFQLTRRGGLGHGADGFAFVLQNSGPEALGGPGSAGGFAVSDAAYDHKDKAIPWSIAVFFDTYRNEDQQDPSSNYIGICTNGRPEQMRWPATRLGSTSDLAFLIKDGKVHTARLVFQAPVLSVFLDGTERPALETVVDLSIVADTNGSAWVGFTASTGGGYENHDILNWSFDGTEVSSSLSMVSSHITFLTAGCLPNRNLCTPEKPLIEKTSRGYHVILPGNAKHGVEVPTVPGQTVDVENAHGMICWAAQTQGADGCSGPAGRGGAAGKGFLDKNAPAGALLIRTGNGRARFGVNGRDNTGFDENEGFYEFDVELR